MEQLLTRKSFMANESRLFDEIVRPVFDGEKTRQISQGELMCVLVKIAEQVDKRNEELTRKIDDLAREFEKLKRTVGK